MEIVANSKFGQRGISEEGDDQKDFTRYGISGGRQILTKRPKNRHTFGDKGPNSRKSARMMPVRMRLISWENLQVS